MSDCISHGVSPWQRYFVVFCVVLLTHWAIPPVLAQQNNGFQYCDTGATPWQCTSSTTTSSTIRTFLPDSLGAPAAFATVSTRLQLTFSSPTGAALTQLLAPYLSGSSASQLVGANATSTQTVEAPLQYTDQDLFAPVGPDRAFDVGVPMMGAVDVVNTRTDTIVEELFRRSRRSTPQPSASSWAISTPLCRWPSSTAISSSPPRSWTTPAARSRRPVLMSPGRRRSPLPRQSSFCRQ